MSKREREKKKKKKKREREKKNLCCLFLLAGITERPQVCICAGYGVCAV